MAKTKHSRTQEAALIVFVAICFVLVVLTVVIAFDESDTGATTSGAYGYPAYADDESTPTPSLMPFTPPPTWDPRTKQPTLTF